MGYKYIKIYFETTAVLPAWWKFEILETTAVLPARWKFQIFEITAEGGKKLNIKKSLRKYVQEKHIQI